LFSLYRKLFVGGLSWETTDSKFHFCYTMKYPQYNLTLNLLTTTIVAPPSNASKWQMGFNLAFKGLMNDELICLAVWTCAIIPPDFTSSAVTSPLRVESH
jgi:hypothetical protein